MKSLFEKQLVQSPSMEQSRAKVAIALVISLVALLIVTGLTSPSLAAASDKSTANTVFAPYNNAERIRPSDIMTYQIYLPLVVRNYPRSSIFGVQMYGAVDSNHGFTRVVQSQAGWVRFHVLWSTIEPTNTTPDNYNWAALDASAQAVQESGISAIFTIEDNPSWAAATPGGPVTNTADYIEFVSAVVARYPYIHYWEIYNEPDRIQRFGKKGAIYATLLQDAYTAIKSTNPMARVVLGGLGLDWFEDQGGPFDRNFLSDVLVNCVGRCFDIANFHYYPFFRSQWETYGHDIIGKANFVRQVLAAHNFVRPVFATETSWPSASSWGSDELAARYVPKAFVRSLAAGLQAAVWYAMLDADVSNPGLLDSTSTPGALIPRPAYTAYQTSTTLLTGARYVNTVPVPAPLEGYQFLVDGKRVDVYWVDCPSMVPSSGLPQDCGTTIPMHVFASSIVKYDLYGTSSIIQDSDDGIVDGKILLNVNSSPIYVDYAP